MTQSTNRGTASVRELRPDLYQAVVHGSCGHVHEGLRFNTSGAAMRYASMLLERTVCGVCRDTRP